jgi:2-desacetyl-2-hydroxyethyl bacteriochlorophyllide A dehydrogenase
MSGDARAFWVTAPGRGEIRSETLRQPAGGDVVVRALYSGISRGTEALVFNGCVPASEWERMRAPFQEGNFPAPVKYGYSMVGRVERGPEPLAGSVVFVLHPHQTCFVVGAGDVHVLPESVPPARAVLAANLETALNGVWDASPHIGDRIAVIGAGTVGCLAAWLLSRIPGCNVELIDINPRRRATARALGITFVEPSAAKGDVDVVIHASGAPEGLDLALRLAGLEARIVELSWFGDRSVPLALGSAFHVRRLTIASSQVGRIAPAQRARWNNRRRMELVMSLLQDASLDVLISGESEFDEMPQVMTWLASAPGDTLCHRIRYT